MKQAFSSDMNPEEQLDEIFRRFFKKQKGMSLYELILAVARADEMGKIEKELTLSRVNFKLLASAIELLTIEHFCRTNAVQLKKAAEEQKLERT